MASSRYGMAGGKGGSNLKCGWAEGFQRIETRKGAVFGAIDKNDEEQALKEERERCHKLTCVSPLSTSVCSLEPMCTSTGRWHETVLESGETALI